MHYLTPQTPSWQWLEIFYIAYFLVHSLANSWYLDLSVLYSLEMQIQAQNRCLMWYTKIPGNFWNKRVVRVGVAEQRADGEQHFWDGQCWRPLRPGVMWCQYNALMIVLSVCHSPEDVETDWSVRVDVGMINLSGEGDLWWLKGVIWNKFVKIHSELSMTYLWGSEWSERRLLPDTDCPGGPWW